MKLLGCALWLIVGCTRSSEPYHPATVASTGPAAIPGAPAPSDAASPSDAAAPTDAAAPSDAPADGRAVALVLDAAPEPRNATPATRSSCAKTYAAVPESACTVADAWNLQCKYPQGHCECIGVRPCAGWAGAYEEARKHPRAMWDCTPTMRPDGCPGDAPAQGSRCTAAGKACMYGSCGGALMACKNGTWVVDHEIGGPPAAPPHGALSAPRD